MHIQETSFFLIGIRKSTQIRANPWSSRYVVGLITKSCPECVAMQRWYLLPFTELDAACWGAVAALHSCCTTLGKTTTILKSCR